MKTVRLRMLPRHRDWPPGRRVNPAPDTPALDRPQPTFTFTTPNDAGARAYLATTLPGLEEVALDEIKAKLPAVMAPGIARGKVFFKTAAGRDQVLALRSVDNVYLLLARLPAGPHRAHLADLAGNIAALDIGGAAVAGEAAAHQGTTFYVNASRAGRQTYNRFEAAAAAAEGIQRSRPAWHLGTPERHDVEFRLDVENGEAILALRLTGASFRFRGSGRHFATAALRPPIAHALVWLSRPRAGERFLDPFCGSGTILAERQVYDADRVIGGDRSPEALAAARANLGFYHSPDGSDSATGCGPPAADFRLRTDSRLALLQWDARRLPLAAGSIDKVVSNLPFGRQVLSPSDTVNLYTTFTPELRRVLSRRGVAYVLTDQEDALARAAARAGLACERVLSLSFKGLHPFVFKLAPSG